MSAVVAMPTFTHVSKDYKSASLLPQMPRLIFTASSSVKYAVDGVSAMPLIESKCICMLDLPAYLGDSWIMRHQIARILFCLELTFLAGDCLAQQSAIQEALDIQNRSEAKFWKGFLADQLKVKTNAEAIRLLKLDGGHHSLNGHVKNGLITVVLIAHHCFASISSVRYDELDFSRTSMKQDGLDWRVFVPCKFDTKCVSEEYGSHMDVLKNSCEKPFEENQLEAASFFHFTLRYEEEAKRIEQILHSLPQRQ